MRERPRPLHRLARLARLAEAQEAEEDPPAVRQCARGRVQPYSLQGQLCGGAASCPQFERQSQAFFPEGTPADAFQVTLGTPDGVALQSGKALSDYKPLTKKVARVHVRLDEDIMRPVLEARALAEAERDGEAEKARAGGEARCAELEHPLLCTDIGRAGR